MKQNIHYSYIPYGNIIWEITSEIKEFSKENNTQTDNNEMWPTRGWARLEASSERNQIVVNWTFSLEQQKWVAQDHITLTDPFMNSIYIIIILALLE